MTRLTHKKKTSVFTVFRMVKKIEGKSLRRSRKPLLSGAMILKRLERSTHLLNDLNNYGNRIIIFTDEKTFIVDQVFNNRMTGRNVWELYLRTELHANICRLQRSFEDESAPMDQEDYWEIRLRLPTGRSAGTHGKDCAGLVGRQH